RRSARPRRQPDRRRTVVLPPAAGAGRMTDTLSSLPDLLLASAARFGARPALAIRRGLRTERWSYQDLARAARLASTRLGELGLAPGDRVLVLAPNTPELVVSMFAVWLVGG